MRCDNDNNDLYRRIQVEPKPKKVDLSFYRVVDRFGFYLSNEYQKPEIYKILASIKKDFPSNERKYLKIVRV